jgi:hypothetical protein
MYREKKIKKREHTLVRLVLNKNSVATTTSTVIRSNIVH